MRYTQLPKYKGFCKDNKTGLTIPENLREQGLVRKIVNPIARVVSGGLMAILLSGCPSPTIDTSNISISNINQNGSYITATLQYDDGNPNTTKTVNAQLNSMPSLDAINLQAM